MLSVLICTRVRRYRHMQYQNGFHRARNIGEYFEDDYIPMPYKPEYHDDPKNDGKSQSRLLNREYHDDDSSEEEFSYTPSKYRT